MDKTQQVQNQALNIIQEFPRSKNGDAYLRTTCGKRIFFRIFVKKYGISGNSSKYSSQDILRRIRLVETFPYFLREYELVYDRHENGRHYFIIETVFFRFVIVRRKKRWELLSFYPK